MAAQSPYKHVWKKRAERARLVTTRSPLWTCTDTRRKCTLQTVRRDAQLVRGSICRVIIMDLNLVCLLVNTCMESCVVPYSSGRSPQFLYPSKSNTTMFQQSIISESSDWKSYLSTKILFFIKDIRYDWDIIYKWQTINNGATVLLIILHI